MRTWLSNHYSGPIGGLAPAVSQQLYFLCSSRLQASERSVFRVSKLPTKNLWHLGHCADTDMLAIPSTKTSPRWHHGQMRCLVKLLFNMYELPLTGFIDTSR